MTRLYLLLTLLTFAVLLAACSMQSASETLIPDSVRAQAAEVVDEVMAGDLSSVREAFPEAAGSNFDGVLDNMAAEVRAGEETAREVVGVQSSTSVSSGDGKTSTYNIGYEVATEAGYTVISQTWSASDGGQPQLSAINIEGSDSSMAARLRRIGFAARIVGFAFLFGLLAIAFIALRRRRLDADNV